MAACAHSDFSKRFVEFDWESFLKCKILSSIRRFFRRTNISKQREQPKVDYIKLHECLESKCVWVTNKEEKKEMQIFVSTKHQSMKTSCGVTAWCCCFLDCFASLYQTLYISHTSETYWHLFSVDCLRPRVFHLWKVHLVVHFGSKLHPQTLLSCKCN